MQILLHEPNAGTRKALQQMLEGLGHHSESAPSIAELDATLQCSAPDLILMAADVGTGVIFTTLDKIRYQHSFEGPVLLMLPEDVGIPTQAELYSAGATDIIPKPLHESIVNAKLLTHAAISENKQALGIMLGHAIDPIIVMDEQGKIVHQNASAEAMLGYIPGGLTNLPIQDVLADSTQFGAMLADFPTEPSHSTEALPLVEFRCKRQNGEIFPVECRRSRLDLQTGTFAMLTMRDISDREAMDQQIRHLAHHDQLTGLINRGRFSDQIRSVLAAAARMNTSLAVLYIDLDNFKRVNDTYGHDTGDSVIKVAAAQLSSCMRESDMLARVGGDEFIAVLTNIDSPAQVATVAKRMNDTVTGTVKNEPYRISTSIGVSIYPHDGLSAEDLISKADEAMYRVKSSGKLGVSFFSATEQREALGKHGHAKLALAGIDNGALTIHHQQIVRVSSLEKWHTELYAAWQHPDLGALRLARAGRYIEDTGVVHALNSWQVNNSLQQAKGTNHAYVRVGAWQLTSALPGMLAAAADRHGHPINRLGVILEMHDIPDHRHLIMEVSRDLAKAGIGFALAEVDYRSISIVDEMIGAGLAPEILIVAEELSRDMTASRNLRYLKSLRLIAMHYQIPLLVTKISSIEQHEVLRRLGVEYSQGERQHV